MLQFEYTTQCVYNVEHALCGHWTFYLKLYLIFFSDSILIERPVL